MFSAGLSTECLEAKTRVIQCTGSASTDDPIKSETQARENGARLDRGWALIAMHCTCNDPFSTDRRGDPGKEVEILPTICCSTAGIL